VAENAGSRREDDQDKEKPMPKKKDPFVSLTWEDLDDWAGSRVASRGRSYKGNVKDLRKTDDGGLLAWVEGSDRYATYVYFDEEGVLDCDCSCPYDWGPCKHAVAVVLVYLDAVKEKESIPSATRNDARLSFVSKTRTEYADDLSTEDDDFETCFGSEGKRKETARAYLKKMKKADLIDLLMRSADEFPELLDGILDRKGLDEGSVDDMVESVRREIDSVSSEPAWWNHWRGEGQLPDYARIRERLSGLFEAGHADAVMELGERLWKRGLKQVAQSDDEGATGREIARCMEVVLKAVSQSSMSPVQQVLWLIDAYQSDDYGLLEVEEDPFRKKQYTKKVWSEVADVLGERLAQFPLANKKEDFHHSYMRERLMRWVVRSLEKGGRKDEIIPLLEQEAPITQCYENLVKRLMATGERAKAKEWAYRGFEDTHEKFLGIASNLETRLREMAERDKDYPLAAAFRAYEFFDRPSLDSYLKLKKAASKSGNWPKVRKAVLLYLEKGVRPDNPQKTAAPEKGRRGKKKPTKSSNDASRSTAGWPLPSTGLPIPSRGSWDSFPETDALIDIAIEEKRNDDVLKWYASSRKLRHGGHGKAIPVAEAVKETHPETAVTIWKEVVAGFIAQTQPAAYQKAKPYLKKMRALYKRIDETQEWEDYISDLRKRYKRKRRLMEVLDSLEGRRIIESH
jgi:uncharacterized Zn finger protein